MTAAQKPYLPWIALACILASWLLATPVGAAPLQLPTTPLQTYYEEQRAIGAESSEALARALLYTVERAPSSRQLAILDQATLIAPTLAEPHLLRAKLLLRRFDVAGAALALRDAYAAVESDAVQRAHWGLQLQGGLHRVLLGTLLVLAVLLLVRTIPFFEHILSARMRAPRAILLMGCAVAAFALWAFPALGTLLLLSLLAPLLGRTERAGLAVLCLLLGAVSLLQVWQQPDALLADPSHRLARLARANLETLPTQQVRSLEKELPTSRERNLVLGLQAARRKQWNNAHRWYVTGLAQDSTWAPTYVNLANLFFALADFERAATGYRTAQSFAEDNPYPHANLAHAYIQMLQYEQSDHELRMASDLGFDALAPHRLAWRHDSVPVVDVALNRHDLRHLASVAVAADPGAASNRLAVWRGPGWQGLPMRWMPWVLFAVSIWLFVRVRWAALAFECVDCRRVCCRHCVPHNEEALSLCCPRCEKLQSRRSGNTLGDGTHISQRPSYAQLADQSPPGMAALFPGAAFFALRNPAPGIAIATVLLAWTVLNLSPTGAIAAATFLLLYLPGLFKLRSSRRIVGV